ncbi:cell wall-binding repeat-containing protein, partial [Peptacetobacter sp.]|uniref:cell wall-binding repeat-containing protein n=1 Tax=Peptacetobacter sp. TaxID=2991975 RepID=UPI002638D67A
MNKKLLSTVMAGTMLATSAAPVFAYTIYEGHQEQILVPDNDEKRQEVFNLLKDIVYGKRFPNNASVYALKVKYKNSNTSSDVINFDFNDKNAVEKNIAKIKDGLFKDKDIESIQLIDRGHVDLGNNNYSHYYVDDTKVAERFTESELSTAAKNLDSKIGKASYSDNVLKVTLTDGTILEYRKGNKKVDFSKPVDVNGRLTLSPNEVVGFEEVLKPVSEEAIKASQNEIKILNDKLNSGEIKSDYVEKIEYKVDENGGPKGLDFSIVLKKGYTFSKDKGANEGYVSKTEGNKRTYWFELRNVPDLTKPQFEKNDPNTKQIVGFDDYKRVISNPGARGEEIDGDIISEYKFKADAPNVEIPHHEELLPKPNNTPVIPDNKPIKPDNKPTVKPIETIAGKDRYDTAIEVAKEIAPVKEIAENGSVVLVNGNALVDGLAAAPLASSVSTTNKVKAAPILLTKTDK